MMFLSQTLHTPCWYHPSNSDSSGSPLQTETRLQLPGVPHYSAPSGIYCHSLFVCSALSFTLLGKHWRIKKPFSMRSISERGVGHRLSAS